MQSVHSWPRPEVPLLSGESVPVSVYDAHRERVLPIEITDGRATVYVCGITPYDATHLGHAATYLAFDTLIRALQQAGVDVTFAQNVTDVDDPLFERANRDGVDWQALAESQTDLFRADMASLRVVPPAAYVRVQDVLPEITAAVEALVADGYAYSVPTTDADADDIYLDLAAVQDRTTFELGAVSHSSPEQLAADFVEFGGDPDRPGKRCPLDPLLWRAARADEPSWPGRDGVPSGRPGWHVECAVVSTGALPPSSSGALITLQGGGRDLRFPHHEMSAAHASALSGRPFASHYAHAGLVAYEGTKMSKSLGNLVLVSRLVAAGHEPAAVRLTVLAHHYRDDWEWFDAELSASEERLERWRAAAARAVSTTSGSEESDVRRRIRVAIGDDLDTPTAIAAVDEWARHDNPAADVAEVVDALLGIQL